MSYLDQRVMGLVDLCCFWLRLGRVLALQMNGVKFKHCWRRGDASSHEILLSFLEPGKLTVTPMYDTQYKGQYSAFTQYTAQSPNEQAMEAAGKNYRV